jgi:hypothetical protein
MNIQPTFERDNPHRRRFSHPAHETESKRRKVRKILSCPQTAMKSNRAVANLTGTSHPFVAQIRRELANEPIGPEHEDPIAHTRRDGRILTGNVASENRSDRDSILQQLQALRRQIDELEIHLTGAATSER